ncbi:MAG: T9SS type A sorting domain-containing protein, partial [Paludibacteraceae bacterium]|nr:T9SS type A sorting domain-containing protein [Paludibacteraceae bacterium]MCR4664596.1 T9SS type A sorting domain-containing protein [Paludibacteraceae bacterium]
LDSRHIKVQTDMSGTYKVYDVTGKQIMSGYFGEEYGNPVIVFSPATADGAYIIRFNANDGTKDTKKWLIR